VQVKPNRFSHAPLHAITNDGLASRPGHGEADAGTGCLIAAETERGEVRARKAEPFVINRAEVAATENPGVLWKSELGPGDRDG
jgi:hypothetical protein